MDNKKRILSLAVAFTFVSFFIIILFTGTGICQSRSVETRIISIYTDSNDEKQTITHIEPQSTWVDRWTTVVWHNKSAHDIKVTFPKGKECQEATEAAIGFMVTRGTGTGACYVTEKHIPHGGTVSALFKHIGKYDYEIEFSGLAHKEKGTIYVRKGGIQPPSERGTQ